MPRAFVAHPCNHCDVNMSAKGMRGFCSQRCRDARKTLTTTARGRAIPEEVRTVPVDAPVVQAARPHTRNAPIGDSAHRLFWFSITIGKGNLDVPMEKFERLVSWMDSFTLRAAAATERGQRKHLLHFQMVAEIRAPPPEDKGHLKVSKSIRSWLRLPQGDGWKISTKYFTKSQSPSAMVGYCLKDWRQGWFNFACKGLSKKDLAKAKHDYLSIRQSYCTGKSQLEKRAFIYEVYKFYAMYLLPMQLNVTQIVRFMVLSGLFTFGNSWILASGDRPLDRTKLYCLWAVVNDPDSASIGQISTILYGDEHAHCDGQVSKLSSVWGGSDDQFANNDNFVQMTAGPNPNDTLTWDEAKERASMERSSAADLDLAAGHVFGENTEVPTSAIVSHRSGAEIPGIFEANSAPLPDGTDPADATDMPVVFELPRAPHHTEQAATHNDPDWTEDADGLFATSDRSSESDTESAVFPVSRSGKIRLQKKKKRRSQAYRDIFGSGSDSDTGSGSGSDFSACFSPGAPASPASTSGDEDW